jgi:hypothetical protein
MLYKGGGPIFFCVEENKEYIQKSMYLPQITVESELLKKKSFMINYFLQLQ